jgi:hypothetical protein
VDNNSFDDQASSNNHKSSYKSAKLLKTSLSSNCLAQSSTDNNCLSPPKQIIVSKSLSRISKNRKTSAYSIPNENNSNYSISFTYSSSCSHNYLNESNLERHSINSASSAKNETTHLKIESSSSTPDFNSHSLPNQSSINEATSSDKHILNLSLLNSPKQAESAADYLLKNFEQSLSKSNLNANIKQLELDKQHKINNRSFDTFTKFSSKLTSKLKKVVQFQAESMSNIEARETSHELFKRLYNQSDVSSGACMTDPVVYNHSPSIPNALDPTGELNITKKTSISTSALDQLKPPSSLAVHRTSLSTPKFETFGANGNSCVYSDKKSSSPKKHLLNICSTNYLKCNNSFNHHHHHHHQQHHIHQSSINGSNSYKDKTSKLFSRTL